MVRFLKYVVSDGYYVHQGPNGGRYEFNPVGCPEIAKNGTSVPDDIAEELLITKNFVEIVNEKTIALKTAKETAMLNEQISKMPADLKKHFGVSIPKTDPLAMIKEESKDDNVTSDDGTFKRGKKR